MKQLEEELIPLQTQNQDFFPCQCVEMGFCSGCCLSGGMIPMQLWSLLPLLYVDLSTLLNIFCGKKHAVLASEAGISLYWLWTTLRLPLIIVTTDPGALVWCSWKSHWWSWTFNLASLSFLPKMRGCDKTISELSSAPRELWCDSPGHLVGFSLLDPPTSLIRFSYPVVGLMSA